MKKIQLILVIIIAISTSSVLAQDDGLMGYWSFDHLSGEIFSDHTVSNNDGMSFGATLAKGIKGNGLYFDGNESFALIANRELSVPHTFQKLGKGSISVWFKVDHIPDHNGIAPIFYYGNSTKCDFFDAANEGLIIEVGHSPIHIASKRVYFTIWKNGCTYPSFCFDSSYPIMEGKWYHLVVVVGEDYNTGYLNGLEMISRNYNFGTSNYSQFFEDAPNPERLWLGKGHWDRKEQYLEGTIDELRIYNKPLSFEQVKTLYADTGAVVTSNSMNTMADHRVEISPRPAMQGFHFQINGPANAYQKIQVYDLNGRMIQQETLYSSEGTIQINGAVPGIYSIHFSGKQVLEKHTFLLEW